MLPIYELKINEEVNDSAEVSFVALVDEPAIKKDFLAFGFVEPSKGEHETEFIPRCVEYVISEGKEPEQATAICYSIWEQHFAGGVSFDYDGVLTTSEGVKKLEESVSRGTNVYIISARNDDSGLKEFASKHGVKLVNVFATGSNKAKVEKIKELGLSKHYDNNPDVIKELGSIGEKFLNYSFKVMNEDKRIISGPLMIPNELIYRNNERFGEHYVKFSPETIQNIAIKYSKKGYQNNVNLMHDSKQVVEGITMFEMFIKDSERGIQAMKGFEELPDGTLFGSYFVENEDVWKRIKSGEFKGFSVEGLFDYVEPMNKEEELLEKIKSLLNETITD